MAQQDSTREQTVLVLDNDAELVAAVAGMLRDVGCRVEEAADAAAAEDILESTPISLAIFEIGLSGTSGFEFLSRLTRREDAPPAVVFTRFGDHDLFRRRSLECGAAEYLDKSMGIETLKAVVSRYLSAPVLAAKPVASERAGTYALVVDDEPIICELIAKFMRTQGYECRHAYNADDARDLIVEGPPLVLFLDIQMPGRTGLDLLRELNTLGLRIPTMIITGLEEPSVGVEAEALGIVGFLHKPFNFGYLKNTVVPKIDQFTG